MTLQDNLFKIISTASGDCEFTYKVRLNPDNIIYKAHFPNNPITPGACMIQMAKEIFECNLNDAFEINKISNIKYLSPLSPVDFPELDIKCTYSPSNEVIKAQFVFFEAEQQFAKMSIIFISKK